MRVGCVEFADDEDGGEKAEAVGAVVGVGGGEVEAEFGGGEKLVFDEGQLRVVGVGLLADFFVDCLGDKRC